MEEIEETKPKRLQSKIWGKLKKSFKEQQSITGMDDTTQVRFILSEYYTKIWEKERPKD